MEYIDKIFYINLEKRKDRLQDIQTELETMNFPPDKVERFRAIELGQIGCIQSHIGVLKLAKERHYRNVLILEDDFHFNVDREIFDQEIRTFFQKGLDFYVLMLSYLCYGCKPYDEQLSIGTDCQDGSAYIVHESIYDSLIGWLSFASNELLKTGAHWLYMNDQIWKKLQKDDKWFILNRRLGQQNGSLSDLANTEVVLSEDGQIIIRENVNQSGDQGLLFQRG
jgi:hypothetical protein